MSLETLASILEQTVVRRYIFKHKDSAQKGVALQFKLVDGEIRADIFFVFDPTAELTVNSSKKVKLEHIDDVPYCLMGLASRINDRLALLREGKIDFSLFTFTDQNVSVFEVEE